MTGEPPFEDGTLHDTNACASPALATTFAGALGAVVTAVGVTAFDAADGVLGPTAFVAVTRNVYDVPLVRPGTTTLVAPPVIALAPPGEAVTE